MLYGSAGYLQTLLALKTAVGKLTSADYIQTVEATKTFVAGYEAKMNETITKIVLKLIQATTKTA